MKIDNIVDDEDKILFQTEVGSHMWGMQRPDSDHDIIKVYAQPTGEILSGIIPSRNKPTKKYVFNGVEYDIQQMEIGHLINLLIKGNINAIWTVTSPIVIRQSKDLIELRKITELNVSKASFASINGLATSNFNDNIKRPGMPHNKAYKQCLRVLNFGIALFERGELVYAPIKTEVTENDIEQAFIELNTAYKNTKLITSPDEDIFRNYLYTLRTSGF